MFPHINWTRIKSTFKLHEYYMNSINQSWPYSNQHNVCNEYILHVLLLQQNSTSYSWIGNVNSSAAHFSRFQFFAKSEKNWPIFREKCEKLRKRLYYTPCPLITTCFLPKRHRFWVIIEIQKLLHKYIRLVSMYYLHSTKIRIWIMALALQFFKTFIN